MKKIFTYFSATFLVSVAFLVFQNNVEAANCGGVTACACGDTVTSDYQLSGDLLCSDDSSGNGLNIGANGITIDGNNFSITGDAMAGVGVYGDGFDNVTVKNFSNITLFETGIQLNDAMEGVIQDNTLTHNVVYGILLSESSENTLTGNTLVDNGNNLHVTGSDSSKYDNTIGITNTVNGKPFLYLYDVHGSEGNLKVYSGSTADSGKGYEYAGEIGSFFCASCSYVKVTNVDHSSGNLAGIYLKDTTYSTIEGNSSATLGTDNAIYLDSSSYNLVTNNNYSLVYSGTIGIPDETVIYLKSSTNNIVSDNSVKWKYGIVLNASTSNTLSGNDVIDSSQGIYLYPNSNNNIIENNLATGNASAVVIKTSSGNIVRNNSILNNLNVGVNVVTNSSSNTISNNTIDTNTSGVVFIASTNNTISGNSFSFNSNGVKFNSLISNILTNNTFFKNSIDVLNGTSGVLQNNSSFHNMKSGMVSFNESVSVRVKNVNDSIPFEISMFDMNGNACSGCTYSVTTSPSEAVTSEESSGVVSGSFVATRPGTYSLLFTMYDSSGNHLKRNYSYFVGDNRSVTNRWYYSNVSPAHGQAYGTGNDSKSLFLTPPLSEQIVFCSQWTADAPDEIPLYPLASLTDISIHNEYRVTSDGVNPVFFAIERFGTYGMDYDIRSDDIASPASVYGWQDESYSPDWSMDYPESWYWMTIKLMANQRSPSIRSTPEEPSHADISQVFTTSPTVKSNSNSRVNIVSATAVSASATTSSKIVLENVHSYATSTTVVLAEIKKPFLNATSVIDSNGTTTITASVPADSSVSVDAVSMELTPSGSGSVSVAVTSWNTSGDYRKEWTETGSSHDLSVQHLITDLVPNKAYYVKVDGRRFGNYASDDLGRLSFVYNGGYSTKSFELVEVPLAPIPGQMSASARQSFVEKKNINTNISTPIVSLSTKFSKNLKAGGKNSDVKSLQQFLNKSGFIVALSGPGSLGNETDFFGTLTWKALVKFQEANADKILKPLGLTKGTGIFGEFTRNYINSAL